jgi:hypothetical protein
MNQRAAAGAALNQEIQDLFDQQQQTQTQLVAFQQQQQLAFHQQQQLLQQVQQQLQAFQQQQLQVQAQFDAQLQARDAQVQARDAQVQAQLNAIQAQLQQVHNIIAQQNLADVPHSNEMRRHSNRIAKSNHPLAPILNNAGQAHNLFPQDKTAMAMFTVAQLDILIAFYGLNGHGLGKQAKLNLLADCFGF